jgi:CBS domain containing-hemolysin-like protein
MLTILYLILVIFLVLANGFFVASEFGLVGVRRSRIQTLAAAGNRKAQRLLNLLDNLNAYISATQLGITMASLALGWIGEPVFAHLLERPLQDRVSEVTLHTISFALAFTIITFLHIVLGELAPKTLALERAEKVALAISWPMQAFYKIFRWPIRLLDYAGSKVVRLVGLHPTNQHGSIYTEAELRHLIDLSKQSGELGSEEQQLIHRIFEFSNADVRDAMVPRGQIQAIPATATIEETREAFIASGYSRLPVFGANLDEIIGLLFRKDVDMGRYPSGDFDLRKVVRPSTYVPASASLREALGRMQATQVHFMFVTNEHGSLEGILTLEDLLEEIVGEINDEYDEESKEQITSDGDAFVLDGMLSVRDANRKLGLNLDESDQYKTIAGFLMAIAGRILKAGDRVEHPSGVFTIDSVDNHRISRILFMPTQNKGSVQSGTSLLAVAIAPFIKVINLLGVELL